MGKLIINILCWTLGYAFALIVAGIAPKDIFDDLFIGSMFGWSSLILAQWINLKLDSVKGE